MTTRAVNAMAGFDWLKRGINLGRNNPKAVFGGAALLLVAVIGVAIVAGLLSGVAVAVLGNNPTAIVIGMAVTALLLALVLRVVRAYRSPELDEVAEEEIERQARVDAEAEHAQEDEEAAAQ